MSLKLTPHFNFIVKSQNRILSYCKSIARNHEDAEDLCQHALMAAIEKIELQPDISLNQLKQFMQHAANNKHYADLRKNKGYISYDANPEFLSGEAEEAVQESVVYAQDILTHIQRMHPLKQEIVFDIIMGMNYDQIAALRNLNVGKVKSFHARAQNELRRLEKA